jgi:uncharacterized OB-fold protein
MSYLAEGMPVPVAEDDGLDAPYWDGARQHRLMIQRCTKCGAFQWGPEWLCHSCLSFEIDWVEIEPTGRIYSWERVWHPTHPALKEQGPYLVILVELPHAGNVRMIGNLLGDPLQAVQIGSAVTADFEDHKREDHSYTLVQWRLAITGKSHV